MRSDPYPDLRRENGNACAFDVWISVWICLDMRSDPYREFHLNRDFANKWHTGYASDLHLDMDLPQKVDLGMV